MLKLKGAKISGQSQQVDVTQIVEIEGAPGVQDIRQIAMPMPFNPPSDVLFQLLGWLDTAAKGVVSTSEEKIADVNAQAPVGTTQALIEQGAAVFSAIRRMGFMRIHPLSVYAALGLFIVGAQVTIETMQPDLGEWIGLALAWCGSGWAVTMDATAARRLPARCTAMTSDPADAARRAACRDSGASSVPTTMTSAPNRRAARTAVATSGAS